MTRTLLYGGSFDPPHVAHVRLPFNAMESLGFDRVLYVPAFQSPLKGPTHTSDTHTGDQKTVAPGGWPEQFFF